MQGTEKVKITSGFMCPVCNQEIKQGGFCGCPDHQPIEQPAEQKEKCPTCKGTGEIIPKLPMGQFYNTGVEDDDIKQTCPDCNGTGYKEVKQGGDKEDYMQGKEKLYRCPKCKEELSKHEIIDSCDMKDYGYWCNICKIDYDRIDIEGNPACIPVEQEVKEKCPNCDGSGKTPNGVYNEIGLIISSCPVNPNLEQFVTWYGEAVYKLNTLIQSRVEEAVKKERERIIGKTNKSIKNFMGSNKHNSYFDREKMELIEDLQKDILKSI